MRYRFTLPVRRRWFVSESRCWRWRWPFRADASKTRLRLERIEPSDDGVRVFASIVELEGQVVDDRPAPSFDLKVNGKKVGRPQAAAFSRRPAFRSTWC